MRRSIRGGLVLAGLCVALTAWACNTKDPFLIPTEPTNPITEVFSGTLNPASAVVHPFSAFGRGTVTLTLTEMNPVTTVGMNLGTWNGTSCFVAVANEASTAGTILIGKIIGAGSVCIRVYDVGNVTDPVAYTLSVVHP